MHTNSLIRSGQVNGESRLSYYSNVLTQKNGCC